MIAGGSGITPMLQVINQMLKDPNDNTEIWLLFANQSEDDILCREQLDALDKEHANLHVWYTIDKIKGDEKEVCMVICNVFMYV